MNLVMNRDRFSLTLPLLAVLAGASFLLWRDDPPSPPLPGPRAEMKNIVLDRLSPAEHRGGGGGGGDNLIKLSAARAVFSPDGGLVFESPKLESFGASDAPLVLQSAAGEMAAGYETLVLRDIRGEVSSAVPLTFRGERMEYGVETGRLTGGPARFTRAGQSFTAGGFTYAPGEGAKFTNGVRAVFPGKD